MARTIERIPWYTSADCRLEDLIALASEPISAADVPHAESVAKGIPVYRAASLLEATSTERGRRGVLAELAWVFLDGPGVAAFKDAVPVEVVDRVSKVFFAMIAEQNAKGEAPIDHYAKPGANDRVWNVIEKLAVIDPEDFVDYYASDMLALACEAWLGPWYQVTSQINCVNPGGQAQSPHRDYHVGFLSDAQAEQFPPHAHRMSGLLTLQGAISHCHMALETGPTKLLPHSQTYDQGFVAWRRPEFIEYFEQHFVQLELESGDAMFFNPAVFHAAGTNSTTDVRRLGNLLQISSPFGRAMESEDRYRMSQAIYPALLDRQEWGWSGRSLSNVLTTASEGYAFPTSLDYDPPKGGLAPPSHTDVMRRALAERWGVDRLASELESHRAKRRTH